MSAACAGVTPGYSARMTTTARAPPMTCAAMKAGAEEGAMPANVADSIRPIVIAGLAKLAEDVKKYAAPMYAPTAAGAVRPRPDRANAKITRTSPSVATISDRKCADVARCLAEILTAARENIRFATTAPPMHPVTWAGQVRGGVPPAQPAEGRVGERHDRVEMAAGDRPEHEDDGEQAGRGRRRVLQQLQAASPGESCWAAMPEPITSAARNALPNNSASSRRHNATSFIGRFHR